MTAVGSNIRLGAASRVFSGVVALRLVVDLVVIDVDVFVFDSVVDSDFVVLSEL